MAQLMEFADNNLILVAALMVILTLIIKTEVEAKLSNVPQLNANDAVRLMNDNDDAIVLDVRENSEFTSGHIKNAIHIPVGSLKDRANELEKYKDKNILIVCRSGSRSNGACKTLSKQGFEHTNNLAGGIMGWSAANLPVSKK